MRLQKKLESDTNTELRKLRAEIQQTYVGLLLEKRLDVYPALYQVLSRFIKVIEFSVVTKSALQELRTQIEQWDSQYSIYFTGKTADVFHEFRMTIAELSELPDEEIQAKINPEAGTTWLRHRVAEIELALKGDLGIYIVEFTDADKERFGQYEEIERVVNQIERT